MLYSFGPIFCADACMCVMVQVAFLSFILDVLLMRVRVRVCFAGENNDEI